MTQRCFTDDSTTITHQDSCEFSNVTGDHEDLDSLDVFTINTDVPVVIRFFRSLFEMTYEYGSSFAYLNCRCNFPNFISFEMTGDLIYYDLSKCAGKSSYTYTKGELLYYENKKYYPIKVLKRTKNNEYINQASFVKSMNRKVEEKTEQTQSDVINQLLKKLKLGAPEFVSKFNMLLSEQCGNINDCAIVIGRMKGSNKATWLSLFNKVEF
jgi:hypothetical protein